MGSVTRFLRFARIACASAAVFAFLLLSACGGGGTSDTPSNNGKNNGGPDGAKQLYSVGGGGVKGPLAYAPFEFYEFDQAASNYQSSVSAASGITDAQAAFSGVLIPAANPPYFLIFSANQNTVDLTTGTTPVITTMKTAVTSEMLTRGYPIYATPLTSIAVELAVANAQSTDAPYNFPKQPQAYQNFLLALPIAARQVVSTLGFGMSQDVDIFNTWPVVGTDSDPAALQAVAEYRAAVEALSTLAHLMGQSAGVSGNQILLDLAVDLADGLIDGLDKQGQPIANLGPNELAILQTADPASLTIPNSPTNMLVGDVESMLADEATSIGATADTTALTDGTVLVTLTPAQLNADRDGDGVLNIADAFPDDAARDTDTDGDGVADVVYLLDINGVRTGGVDQGASDPDDDDDGKSDSQEKILGTDPLKADTDGDGIYDSVELTAVGSTIQLYGVFTVGIYDGTGTDPLLSDTDGDGLLDGVEFAAAGSTFIITEGPNAGTYIGTGTDPNLSDTDGDGLDDGVEVTGQSDPLVTDTDADGLVDSLDNCPAVANPDQADSNFDGIGDACSQDLTGVWKMTFQINTMTWNACDRTLLGTSYDLYESIQQDALGNLTAIDHRGVPSTGSTAVGVNIFNLQGSATEVDPQYGNVITRQVSIDARINLDGTMSGSYAILEEVDGVAICLENGDLNGTFVYKHQGNGSQFSGKYALEHEDLAYSKFDPPNINKQSSGYLEFDITGSNYMIYENHVNESVISRLFKPSNGAFERVTQADEVKDANFDGIDDLVRTDETVTGLMVRDPTDVSGATMVFQRVIKTSTYYNTTVYDPNLTPHLVEEKRLDGYGRQVLSAAYNETVARPDANGNPLPVDRIGLSHPSLKSNTQASQLRYEVYLGTNTTVAPLCSVDMTQGLVFVNNYPQADMTTEAISNGEHAYVACDIGAEGTVLAGSVYRLAIVDDLGTPLNPDDDQINDFVDYTAVSTNAAPVVIPDRRSVAINGALPSQTQANLNNPINGYFNPYANQAMTWTDIAANEYRLSFRDYNPALETRGNYETRVMATTPSAVIPEGVLAREQATAVEISARFDDVNGSSWTNSQHLSLLPSVSGIFNVEMVNSLNSDELYFQMVVQRTSQNAVLCTITYSNQDISCDSFYILVDWLNNTISLNFSDPNLNITGERYFYMDFQFTDAVTANVSVGNYAGTAQLVTTELRAQTQVLADGTQSTVLRLENPLPRFSSAQLGSGSGTVDLDGLGGTILTLWDEMDVDPANHFTAKNRGAWEHPAADMSAPTTATRLGYDSGDPGLGVLADDAYEVTFMTQLWQGAPDAVYRVSYTAADPSPVQGPMMADMMVNAVAAAVNDGDTYLTPRDISAQSAFDMDWIAYADGAAQWALVIRQVDVDGSVTGVAGAVIPGKTWRTPYMDPVGSLVYTPGPTIMDPGTWAWTNGGFLDLASYLAAGEVAQVQVVSRDAAGDLQGISDPVYVKLGP
jgi:hypothetical protein